MLRCASKILGYRLSARDGEVGRCVDFLIEDQSWGVRHVVVEAAAVKTLVVKAGEPLQGQELLVSPQALPKAAWNFRRWLLESTRDQLQLEVLPPPDRDETADEHDVSFAELELSPSSEVSPKLEHSTSSELAAPPNGTLAKEAAAEAPPLPDPLRTPLLRSLKELLGYGLEAEDGPVGHIADLIVNDDSWTCPYLVVSDSTRSPVRQVLLPVEWVKGVDTERRAVSISSSIERVQTEPEFHPEAPRYATGVVQSLLGSSAAANSSADGRGGQRGPEPLVFRSASRASRAWRLGSPAALANALTWGTRGLKAALARTLQGRER
jgi:hypothetical protein